MMQSYSVMFEEAEAYRRPETPLRYVRLGRKIQASGTRRRLPMNSDHVITQQMCLPKRCAIAFYI